jgi:hypothetical protein
MLSDRLCRMLTAYVDGELNDDQRKAVLSLLRGSAKARDLLRRLQSDADCLRQLPRAVLGRDVSAQVVQILQKGNAGAGRRSFMSTMPRVPARLSLAAAATVLLAAGAATYFYFSAVHETDANLSKAAPEDLLASARRATEEESQPVVADHRQEAKSGDSHAAASSVEKLPPPRTSVEKVVELLPHPSAQPVARKEDGALGTRVEPATKFLDLNVDPPLFAQFRELDQEKRRKELEEELRKGKARRMDLTCLEMPAAIQRLQLALKKEGIEVIVDHDADNRLRLGLKTEYALYVDSVTAEEVVAVMRQLRSDDREREAKRRASLFETFVLNAFGSDDQRNLSRLLGSDPTSSSSAQKGQGGTAAKVKQHMALLVTYSLENSRSTSQEVKLFLESRGERQAGTWPMLLVLRKTKN